MPLATGRINHQPSTHPNPLITFITPLPSTSPLQPDHARALSTLRAIAAQSLPLMRTHHLSIVTLEEHEPNKEFVGRNFNHGEIIQLVLRTHDGRWLSIKTLMGVMVHELAHCTHMNHSRAFWGVREGYMDEVRGLWSVGFTGEGFWGGGFVVGGDGERGGVVGSRELEETGVRICGGTFRRRVRKRKVKEGGKDETWKEKRDRRIEKKFGKNGVSLGEDEDERLGLEVRSGAKTVGSKPRVAQSKRGRELRAAAALKRFEIDQAKKEVEVKNETEEDGSDDYEETEDDGEAAVDGIGRIITDAAGKPMVRVCGDGDLNDEHVKGEMNELFDLESIPITDGRLGESDDRSKESKITESRNTTISGNNSDHWKNTNELQGKIEPEEGASTESNLKASSPNSLGRNSTVPSDTPSAISKPSTISTPVSETPSSATSPGTICPMCTTATPPSPTLLTCPTCAHVLFPARDPRSWSCQSQVCLANAAASGTNYINAGDCGICAICGERKTG